MPLRCGIPDKEKGTRAASASAAIRQVRRIQQEEAIDILLISSGYTQEIRKEIQAGSVFVLTETAARSTGPLEVPVYRYQSARPFLLRSSANAA